MAIFYKHLSVNNWTDIESLFGAKGACGGCWCMWWRLRHRDYENSKGHKNKELLKKLVNENKPLGIIAYENEKPIGWCSISPRKYLIRLETSRIFKPLDTVPVWSITCLYVNKDYRNKGLSGQLINWASEYAFNNGAMCIESYPILNKKKKTPDTFAFVGLKTAFEKASFKVIKQASETRCIMRTTRVKTVYNTCS